MAGELPLSYERIRLWMAVRLARGEGFRASDIFRLGMTPRSFYRAIADLERVGLRIDRQAVPEAGNRCVTYYRGYGFDSALLEQLTRSQRAS